MKTSIYMSEKTKEQLATICENDVRSQTKEIAYLIEKRYGEVLVEQIRRGDKRWEKKLEE